MDNKIDDLEMLMDGTLLEITFRPESKDAPGKTERVIVRKIPICDIDPLGKAWGKAPLEVACYLDRPLEEVRKLSDESFSAVMSEGRRLNFISFQKWFEWQQETLRGLGTGTDMEKLVKSVTDSLIQAQKSA